MMLKRVAFISIIFLFGSCKQNQKIYLYDNANLLTTIQQSQLDKELKEYEKKTTAEIVVFTKKNLKNYTETPAEYSTYLLNDLKIGQRGINNGVLIFIALQEKAVEVRLGYGVEWVINKKETADIVSIFLSYFKEGKFYNGLDSGIKRIEEKLDSVSWSMCSQEDEEVGCIKKLRVKEITNVDEQFIEIKTEDGYAMKVFYTDSMHSIIKGIARRYIYIRVKGKNEALLLGVD